MCPFCENRYVMAKPGKVHCSMCYGEFEVDDRLECIFVDPDKLKLPAKSIVCPLCGLIHNDDDLGMSLLWNADQHGSALIGF